MENNQATKSIIGEDIEIVGSIKCSSPIRIDGKLNGDLTCSGTAIIGNTAAVKGNMSVESVTIHGQIDGNVTARDRIELKSTARLHGDIKSKRLTVEDGVTFVGKSEVNPTGQAAKPAESASAGAGETDADAKAKSGGMFGKK
jgi:cytoskeletal protein CcmA (bactofilin family)